MEVIKVDGSEFQFEGGFEIIKEHDNFEEGQVIDSFISGLCDKNCDVCLGRTSPGGKGECVMDLMKGGVVKFSFVDEEFNLENHDLLFKQLKHKLLNTMTKEQMWDESNTINLYKAMYERVKTRLETNKAIDVLLDDKERPLYKIEESVLRNAKLGITVGDFENIVDASTRDTFDMFEYLYDESFKTHSKEIIKNKKNKLVMKFKNK